MKKTIPASADVPTANPLATPAPTISSLTMFFNSGDFIFPETVGAPNVLDWIIPKGLLPSCLYCFSNDNAFKVSSNGNFKSSI